MSVATDVRCGSRRSRARDDGGADVVGTAVEPDEHVLLGEPLGHPLAPLHGDDGLPTAVQIAGRPADEATLLSLTAQLEAARPWADRRPELATA